MLGPNDRNGNRCEESVWNSYVPDFITYKG